MTISDAIDMVIVELAKAINKFGKFNSEHEGYAVIKEELDELWDEIKGEHRAIEMRDEAKQVAAMALRFMVDLYE